MNLEEFLTEQQDDPNLFWRLDCGDHQNLLEEAVEKISRLSQVEAETVEQWDEIAQPACTTCGTPTARGQHCRICHPDQP